MKKSNLILKKVAVATVIISAIMTVNLKNLHAAVGHVSCQMNISYESSFSSRTSSSTREISFDMVPGRTIPVEELLNSNSINNTGPNVSFGYRVEGTYPGNQFTPNQPGQLVFTLLAPGASTTLPIESSRRRTVSVPFIQNGPLQSNQNLAVGWSTALIPRFCLQPLASLKQSIIGQIEMFSSYLEAPTYRSGDGWLELSERLQSAEAAARRARNSRTRTTQLQEIARQRSALLATVQHDLGAPTNPRAFIQFLKEKRNHLIQSIVWLSAENQFPENPDETHRQLLVRVNAIIARFEAVLRAVGVTDRDITSGGFTRGMQSAVAAARRTTISSSRNATTRERTRSAALARLRSQAVANLYGPNSSITNSGILAESGMDNFDPAQIEINERACAIVHVTVERCVVSNMIADESAHPATTDSGVDGGTDASVADDSGTRPLETTSSTTEIADPTVSITPEAVLDAGSSADDAAVPAPAAGDNQETE